MGVDRARADRRLAARALRAPRRGRSWAPCGGGASASRSRTSPASRAFGFIELAVDRRVLIPRPETEFVVEAALGLPAGARVVDVGTGSGAIALALKHERPDLEVFGDRRAATRWTSRAANAVAARARRDVRRTGDLLAGLEADAIVSNPPYVVAGDVADARRRAVRAAAARCSPARRARRDPAARARRVPFLAVEHGAGQADAVEALARAAGYAGGADPRPGGHRASGRSGGDADARRSARASLRGGVAVFPADTVYGLACDPANADAIARLYALKGRPPDKPSATMFFDLESLPEVGPRTRALMERLLPGKVTLILPTRRAVPLAAARPVDLGCACRSSRRSGSRSCSPRRTSRAGPTRGGCGRARVDPGRRRSRDRRRRACPARRRP